MKKLLLFALILTISLAACACGETHTYSISKVESELTDSSAADESSESSGNTVTQVHFTAEYASEEFMANPENYHFYDDPDNDWTPVLFKTNVTVTNVRFLEIDVVDFDAIELEYKEVGVLYTLDEMTPEKPFVAETEFADILAVRGISFQAPDGSTRTYILQDSAMDGSLIFTELAAQMVME